jgi:CelD/BcsL family acetyltransferase involved in cellulose biosynthesis
MELEVVQDINRFRELREDWNSLLEKSSSKSVFLTWEWLFNWWVHFKNHKELLILLVKDEMTRQIVGIAPFCLQELRLLYFFKFNKIMYIGSDKAASDFLDFIIHPGSEDNVVKLVYEYLKKNGDRWDIVEVGPVDECSSSIGWVKENVNGEHRIVTLKAQVCPYLKLKEDYEKLLQSLSLNMRQSLKRRTKCFENKGGMSFSIFNTREKVEENMDRLFSLHMDRFKSKGGNRNIESSFSGADIKRFHYDIASSFLEKQWLKLYFLNYENEPIASLYAFKYKDKLYYYQSGFSSNWEKLSLGTVLFGYAIRDSINERLKEFHFLRGEEKYKSRWTKDYRETRNLLLFNSTFSGEVLYILMRGERYLKRALRKGRVMIAKLKPYLIRTTIRPNADNA